ncbi:MAG: aminodeoxychorismate lyase [Woeseiaceae bacterium]
MSGIWFSDAGRTESLPIDDRGLHYGDGLFETIAIRSGKPRLWPLHFERLQLGCERLAIPPPRETYLLDLLARGLQEAAGLNPGLAKLIVTRGSSPRGYRFPAGQPARVLLGLFEKPHYPATLRARGINMRICATRLSSQTALAGMKTLNRLEQVIARSEWQHDAVSEGLMLDENDYVVCGTMSNLFVVRNAVLQTPPVTTSGVCGVMRRQILSVAAENRIPVVVEPLPVDNIDECVEMFICNSQIAIWPVRRCGAIEFDAPGSITAGLVSMLAKSGIEECLS